MESRDHGYYTIDWDEMVLKGEGGEISFDYEDDTIYIEDDEYVKVNSKRFKELQKE